MPSVESIWSIEIEGERLLDLARSDPDRTVPQYPGWTMRDLISHTASIHGRTTLICETLPTERVSAPRLPDGADALDWYEANLAGMVAALKTVDSDAEVWTFGGSQTVAFWERRMVVETGVHRWDADNALENESPLFDYVAKSGLDEFPEMWLAHLGELPTLEINALDIGESWVYGDGPPSESVEGLASAIYLRLMSRPGAPLPEPWEAAVDSIAPTPKR